jgi:hypothetical protein
MKLVLSAFPAVGKSTIFKEADERGLKPAHVFFNDFTKEYEIQVPAGDGIPVFDSDSSKFDKEFFPGNYVKHIKDTLERLDDVIILVSSHEAVREMLRDQGIDYVLAYPERELKEEYIQRYISRGNTEGFIGMMKGAWNDFIDSCEADPASKKIVLGEGEFLGQDYLAGDLFTLAGMENMNDDPDWFNKSLKQGIKEWAKELGSPDEFHESLKSAIANGGKAESNPIDFEARLARMNDRRDPLGIEEEKVVMSDFPILNFPDGSTGDGSDQVAIVRYNNEWQAYLAENPDADVSYIPIEIMGGESLGDILHAPNGTTIDMAQPGWHDQYKAACNVVLEEKPNTLITATIVDVNAGPEVTDQQTLPTDNPEPAVLDTPEGIEQATLTAEAPEGGVAAVDAATIAEPGPEVSTEAAERNPMVDPDFVEAIEPAEPGRAELIEAQFDMQNDIETLETVITGYRDAEPESAGLEQFADGSELLTAAAEDIKQRYGTEIEPTIAGMEGFLEQVKSGFNNIAALLKKKPASHELSKIKKDTGEGWGAFNLYTSEKWQAEQKFINVGKVKLSVPGLLESIDSPADAKTILNLVTSRVEATYKKAHGNAKERIANGVKVFNKFKNSPEDTPISEGDSSYPIKPELITGVISDAGLDSLDVKTKAVEVPVLNKDKIKEVGDLVYAILEQVSDMAERTGKLSASTLEEDDFYKSKFWDKHLSSDLAGSTIDACSWEYATDELVKLEKAYQDKMLNILKFLEQWVLKSVK